MVDQVGPTSTFRLRKIPRQSYVASRNERILPTTDVRQLTKGYRAWIVNDCVASVFHGPTGCGPGMCETIASIAYILARADDGCRREVSLRLTQRHELSHDLILECTLESVSLQPKPFLVPRQTKFQQLQEPVRCTDVEETRIEKVTKV